MEKISGILTPSARVTSVDLEDSQPSRPGSPNIGQKQGVVRINDRFNLSQQAKEMAAKETIMGRNPKEIAKSKIVSDMTRNFFETRVKPQAAPVPASEATFEAIQKQPAIPVNYNESAESAEEVETGTRFSVDA